MPRRVHVPSLHPSRIDLPSAEAHHVRDVLRMQSGDALEVFDDAGQTADAVIVASDSGGVTVQIQRVAVRANAPAIVVAAAVPKGDRADWMVEKLSELGVSRFIPLRTARSVVHPEGTGKIDRWKRIATEAAKQSHRTGVMSIEPLTPLDAAFLPGIWLSPTATQSLLEAAIGPHQTVFIGPEGGWTDEEIEAFHSHNIVPSRMTTSILRIETAAILAAGILLSR